MERWATFDCYGTLVDWNGGLADSWSGSSASSGRRAPCPLPRDRAGDPGRGARSLVPGGADARARAAAEETAARRCPRARRAPLRARCPTGRCSTTCARGWARRTREAGDSEFSSNTDRDLIEASMECARRAVRRRDRRRRDRLVQAGAPALGGLPRADRRRRRDTSTSPRASSTTSSRRTSSASRRSGSTGSARPRTSGRTSR